VHRHFRELELNTLKFGDRFAELPALPGVGDGMLKGAVGKADKLSPNGDTAAVQRFNGYFVSFAQLAEDVGGVDAAVVQDDFAGRGTADSEFVLLPADGQAGSITFDEKTGDAAVASLGIDRREDQEEARFGGVGYPEFAAGQQVIATIGNRAGG
jgi:hypothetical protein